MTSILPRGTLRKLLIIELSMATLLFAACEREVPDIGTPTSSPTSNSIDISEVFHGQTPCEFFEADRVRTQVGLDSWNEGDPESGPAEGSSISGSYGSCAGSMPIGEEDSLVLTVDIQASTDTDWLLSVGGAEAAPAFESYREVETHDLQDPWQGGESFTLTDHEFTEEYQVGAIGIGQGFGIGVNIAYVSSREPGEYCPEEAAGSDCPLTAASMLSWVEDEYLPMMYEKITAYTGE